MHYTYRIASICALLLGSVLPSFSQEGWRFTLRPEESEFTVKVGRAGFLKVFGHDHLVAIRGFNGEVLWQPEQPEASSIRIEVQAASLTVVGEDEEERTQIQADMEAKALEVESYPQILFVSEELSLGDVEGGEYRGRVTGQITLRGVTNTVTIPLTLTVSEQSLRAQGEFQIKGSDFGVEQVSAAGGAVKTSDDLELTFDLAGVRQ